MTTISSQIIQTFPLLNKDDSRQAVRELSKRFDVTQAHVKKVLSQANLIKTPRGMRPPCIDRVRKDIVSAGLLFCKGLTPRMIAYEMNRSFRSVIFYLQSLNLAEGPLTQTGFKYLKALEVKQADVKLQQMFEEELKRSNSSKPKRIYQNRKKIEGLITIKDVWPYRYENSQNIAEILDVHISHVSKVWRKANLPHKAKFIKADLIARVILRAPYVTYVGLAREFKIGHETASTYANWKKNNGPSITTRQAVRKAALENDPVLVRLVEERLGELKFSEHIRIAV